VEGGAVTAQTTSGGRRRPTMLDIAKGEQVEPAHNAIAITFEDRLTRAPSTVHRRIRYAGDR
jgi:hypothetical protein